MIEINEQKFEQKVSIDKDFEERARKRFSPSDQQKIYNQRPIIKTLVNQMKKLAE